MMKNAIPFIAIAGRTTVTNKNPNGMFTPMTKMATDRKIVPDNSVPQQAMMIETIKWLAAFLSSAMTANTTNAVMNLSMTFGMNPPGRLVKIPDRTPVVAPSKKTLLTSGNKKMPMNIIVSMKSGFMPSPYPGMTKYKAAPTDISSAINVRFFVFNSHLSSTRL